MVSGQPRVVAVEGGSRAARGSRPATALESFVDARLMADIRRGAAPFQQDTDGWGVTCLVDRRPPAAFPCDQDLVLRQSMADEGWAAPQFVARADGGAGGDGVDLPRHSAVQALGGCLGESAYRRVWHVSRAGATPAPRSPVIEDASRAARIVVSVAAAAGVRVAEGGAVAVAPSVVDRGLACVVPHRRFRVSEGPWWASTALRAVVGTLARSRLVGQVVQLFAFERFVSRAVGGGGGRDRAAVLARVYWAVAESLGRAHSVTLAPGCGDRLLYEDSTRTLVVTGDVPGVRRSVEALFRVAEVSGERAVEAAAERRDPVALLRASGVGGPVSHPERAAPTDRDARAALVAALAAKRVAERLGLPYLAGPFSDEFTAGALRVLGAEGWRSVAVEAGNLAGWLVDGVRGLAFWPAALE